MRPEDTRPWSTHGCAQDEMPTIFNTNPNEGVSQGILVVRGGVGMERSDFQGHGGGHGRGDGGRGEEEVDERLEHQLGRPPLASVMCELVRLWLYVLGTVLCFFCAWMHARVCALACARLPSRSISFWTPEIP